MNSYMSKPLSRGSLRKLTFNVRKLLGLQDTIKFPIVECLDALALHLPDFSYEIVENNYFDNGIHASTNVLDGHIQIAERVYDGACNNEGRDRMTIAHELGHYILNKCCGIELKRNYNDENIKAYKDPEWQAKCFAGELLIPYNLTKTMSINQIVNKCCVSFDAATYHYNIFNKRKLGGVQYEKRKACK